MGMTSRKHGSVSSDGLFWVGWHNTRPVSSPTHQIKLNLISLCPPWTHSRFPTQSATRLDKRSQDESRPELCVSTRPALLHSAAESVLLFCADGFKALLLPGLVPSSQVCDELGFVGSCSFQHLAFQPSTDRLFIYRQLALGTRKWKQDRLRTDSIEQSSECDCPSRPR